MDGQWKRWICAGLLAGVAGAAGCSKQQQLQQPQLPGTPQPASGLAKYFGGNPGGYQAPPPVSANNPDMAMLKAVRKPGQVGLNPETEVALAATYIASAMEKQTASERDALLDLARQNLQRALQKEPKSREAHVELARLYAFTGEKDRSIHTLMQARQMQPKDHDLAYQQARICVTFGDWVGGLEAINAGLAIDPENRTYHKVAGVCLAHQSRYDQAQGAFTRVMPESQARYFLGRIMIDQNQLERGKMQIEQAVALDPKNELATQFLTDFSQGHIKPMDSNVQLVEHQEPASGR